MPRRVGGCVGLADVAVCSRHVGDLGNVEVTNGRVETTITDHMVSLYTDLSVIGRSIVVCMHVYQPLFTARRSAIARFTAHPLWSVSTPLMHVYQAF